MLSYQYVLFFLGPSVVTVMFSLLHHTCRLQLLHSLIYNAFVVNVVYSASTRRGSVSLCLA